MDNTLKKQIYLLLILISSSIILSGNSNAEEADNGEELTRSRNYSHRQLFFKKTYYGVGLAKNTPIRKSEDFFTSGYYHPKYTYKFNLEDRWLTGVSVQFKTLRKKDLNETLAILAISQQSMYLIRLYHPTYLQVGGKLLYLLPTNKTSLPLKKDTDYSIEVGLALSSAFTYALTDKILANIFIDVWRGTKTKSLQAYEAGIEIDYSFN
ncbi:MAG: hypothetical protein R3B45_03430 [Bdellovibrionota bacterium]